MNNFDKAEEAALKLLRRMYSRRRLCAKLREKGYAPDVVSEVADKMERLGYINDEQYARAYVHDAVLLQKYGPRKIKQGLFQRGIDTNLAAEALSEYDEEIYLENIRVFLIRACPEGVLTQNEAARFYRRMESRGFFRKHIDQVLNEVQILDDSIDYSDIEV